MKTVLLINGSKAFGKSEGNLNAHMQGVARDYFLKHNVKVLETVIDAGYSGEQEVEKHLEADAVILQYPGWWMDVPWIAKEYFDKVYSGSGIGKLYTSDGRTRSDATKLYGSGGLCQGKYAMLSTTWNAPAEAFNDPEQFFGGIGFDGVSLQTRKMYEFMGFSVLPGYMANDVHKETNIDKYTADYLAHLAKVFGHLI